MFGRGLAVVVAIAGLACSCSSPASPPIDLTTPKVSFKTDVVAGVFNESCGLSMSCHGSPAGGQSGLFLGEPSKKGSDASAVRARLVDVASTELPGMPLVTAGDLAKSFLLHKMDGDQNTLDKQCTGGACLSSMPQGSDILPSSYRDTVRRWIAQGAQDN